LLTSEHLSNSSKLVLDATNGSVYLIGLNLADGTAKYQITLPFTESIFVGAGQGLDVDPKNGDVFVFGRDNQTGPTLF
jgi:hypothetical protein